MKKKKRQNQAPSPFPDSLDWTISGLTPALAQPLSFSEAAVLFEISFCARLSEDLNRSSQQPIKYKYCYHHHFTNEGTEARSNHVTHPRMSVGETELVMPQPAQLHRAHLCLWPRGHGVKVWLAFPQHLHAGLPWNPLIPPPCFWPPWHPDSPLRTSHTFLTQPPTRELLLPVFAYQEIEKVTFPRSICCHSHDSWNQFYSLFIFLRLSSLFQVFPTLLMASCVLAILIEMGLTWLTWTL